MPGRKTKRLPYKKKREGKTNYRKRLRLLLAGKPRLVIRLTNQKIIAQIIEFKPEGDRVLAALDSSALRKYGWSFSLKNLPAAYLTGYLLGKKALQKKIEEAILDMGFRSPTKGNKIYGCLKGAREAGLKIPCSEEAFPPEERIAGKHIQEYAQKIKENKEIYQKRFFQYLKNNLEPIKITENFQKTKELIEKKE